MPGMALQVRTSSGFGLEVEEKTGASLQRHGRDCSCVVIQGLVGRGPEVTIGEMPSSIRVPRFDARITRIQ